MPDEDLRPSEEAAPPAVKAPEPGGRFDWLSLALILVILANVGLYVYNTAENARPGEDQSGRGGSTVAASGERTPGPGHSPGPPVSTAPPGPGGPNASGGRMGVPLGDFTALLTSPQGLAALIELDEAPGALALQPDQKKRLARALEERDQGRSLGSGVLTITALLRPAQLEFLRSHKEELSGTPPPAGKSALQAAVEVLQARAGNAAPARDTVPASGAPEFDPVLVSTGMLLLDRQKGPLALEPAQAASIAEVLKGMAAVDANRGEDPGTVLTDDQRKWVQERSKTVKVERYVFERRSASSDPGSQMRRLVVERFSKS